MKALILATAMLIASASVQAEILEMRFFGTDAMGNNHQVEKKFYNYGTKEDGWKYKGTRWIITDPIGRTTLSTEVYLDCSDQTWGFDTPTTDDIPSGSVIHAIYQEACK